MNNKNLDKQIEKARKKLRKLLKKRGDVNVPKIQLTQSKRTTPYGVCPAILEQLEEMEKNT